MHLAHEKPALRIGFNPSAFYFFDLSGWRTLDSPGTLRGRRTDRLAYC